MIDCITQRRYTFDFNMEYANLYQSINLTEALFHYENITNNKHRCTPESIKLAKYIYEIKCRRFSKAE